MGDCRAILRIARNDNARFTPAFKKALLKRSILLR